MFSSVMHVACSYLNFKWFSLRPDNCGVEGLIEVKFGHCYVIFEPSLDGVPGRMD